MSVAKQIHRSSALQYGPSPYQVSLGEIRDTLSIYRPEYIFLTAADFSPDRISGTFNLEPYPFTHGTHIEYVTAAMYLLYTSQLGYVFLRLLARCGRVPLSESEFLRARDEGQVVIARMDHLQFRRKVSIAASPIRIDMELVRNAAGRRIAVGDVSVSAAGASFTGDFQIAVIRSRGRNV